VDLLGRTNEARAVLDECLRLHPDQPAALAERGRIALRDGDLDRAEENLSRAIGLDPGKIPPRYQLYLTLGRMGKKEEAAKEQEAIRRVEADMQRISELLRGRLQEAPNDPEAPYEVAMIALRAGLPKEALRWLQAALQVDPNHLPTHRALASFYHETGNPILSARHRALARRLSSQQPPRKGDK
jgi:tetratricopeptide (TPR) repeat protein